jgi:hypothetical protein
MTMRVLRIRRERLSFFVPMANDEFNGTGDASFTDTISDRFIFSLNERISGKWVIYSNNPQQSFFDVITYGYRQWPLHNPGDADFTVSTDVEILLHVDSLGFTSYAGIAVGPYGIARSTAGAVVVADNFLGSASVNRPDGALNIIATGSGSGALGISRAGDTWTFTAGATTIHALTDAVAVAPQAVLWSYLYVASSLPFNLRELEASWEYIRSSVVGGGTLTALPGEYDESSILV